MGARLWPCRFAASRRPRSARRVNLKAVAAPNEAAAAEYYPAIYWYSMLKIPEANLFPGTGLRPATACRHDEGSGPVAPLPEDRQLQLLPPDRRQVDPHDSRFARPFQHRRRSLGTPHPVGPGEPADGQRHRQFRHGARADRISAIGPTASPRANCPSRSRRVRSASSATSSSPSGTGTRRKAYLHDEIATDRRNPTVNAHGLIYGSPEAQLGLHSVARSGRQQVRPDQDRMARSEDADHEDRSAIRRIALLGQRSDLGQPHRHP